MNKANGEDLEALRNSGLFDEKWYLEQYPDVKVLGMDPLEHYLWVGKRIGRKPSANISEKYLLDNTLKKSEDLIRDPAVVKSRINSVSSYTSEEEARVFLEQFFSEPIVAEPHRLYEKFDTDLTIKFLSCISALREERDKASSLKASVIMPTHNRASKISAAIESVLKQSHNNLELIIIDDGSTDSTSKIIEKYNSDKRIKTYRSNHLGVSSARNIGLENASGDYIFYLDSDNIWNNDFIHLMLTSMVITGSDCAYGATRLQDIDGKIIGYRGERFDWNHCLRANYVDMNVFCHSKKLINIHGYFDTSLKRMVDWDIILRYTKNSRVIYCPIIGCIYIEDSQDANRITISQPYIFRKIVHQKNANGHKNVSDCLANIKYNIAIKIPAPYDKRNAWGDYHFAESLKEAFIRDGHNVRIDFYGQWYDRPKNDDDIAIVLRGLTEYLPQPGQLSLIWNISHPDQVSYDEYLAYDGVFVASESYAALLSKILQRPVEFLLQCTDTKRFKFVSSLPLEDSSGVFVGNSRKKYRSIVKWSINNNISLDVYGQHWEEFIPNSMIKAQNIDNSELFQTYSSAKFVLNDHWESMRDYGYISNRVFDVLGCGGRLITDYIPAIPALFGDQVVCVDGEDKFRDVFQKGLKDLSDERRLQISDYVHSFHSFDQRAKRLLEWVNRRLSGNASTAASYPDYVPTAPNVARAQRIRVGLLLQSGRAWPTSSAFIRLIGPLTTDSASNKFELVYLSNIDDEQINDIDVCIVQRIAVDNVLDAERFVNRLRSKNIPLCVDNDDAFSLTSSYSNADKAMRILMNGAKEVWFSTEILFNYYGDIKTKKRVIKNNLDPRFWKNYRNPVNFQFDRDKIRFLYMGTATHDEDFELCIPAMEQMFEKYRDRFDLTIVGAVRSPPKKEWLKILSPPPERGSYPMFARWLMLNNNFDVGIAPLANSKFNRAKSDIKFLDYSALGLLSIVTKGPAYMEAIDKGLAIGCAGDPESWYKELVSVASCPDKYVPMRRQAHEYVWHARNCVAGDSAIVEALEIVMAS